MPSDDLLLGHKFGSYQIVSELGRGGMGKVYLAEHPTIGKKIAIKVLNRDLSREESILQRFFHEAKAVNDIHHQNVVDILDVGRTEEGLYYLLMEHLTGMTLFDALRAQGRFSAERLGHIGLQLCSALAATHQHGIIHRDLKSDNVFLSNVGGQKDFVKLLDFGIAKLLEYEEDGHALTQEGLVMGTPAYMAPEQALGEKVDQQSDIYSLGIILYQMATCSLPFVDSNPVVVATMQVSAELPLPRTRCPELSPVLEAVIVKCLAKHKEDRYKTMMELALELSLACRVDPRPYFELDRQQRLATLLAAKQTPTPETPAIALEPTVQSYVFGNGALTGQESTEQSETPKLLMPTVRLARRLRKSPGTSIAAALCAVFVVSLLYWSGSSAALTKEPNTPYAVLTALPHKEPNFNTTPAPRPVSITQEVSAPETMPVKPVLLPIKDISQRPKKTPTPNKEVKVDAHKPQLINPFFPRPKRR